MKQGAISNKVLLVLLFVSAVSEHLDDGIQHAESLRGCFSRMDREETKVYLVWFHGLCQAAHSDPFLQGQSIKRCGEACPHRIITSAAS